MCSNVICAAIVAFVALPVVAQAQTMRAAVVNQGKLEIRAVERPTAGAGQVRVRVYAAGVNPIDWKMASGYRQTVPANGGTLPVATTPASLIPGLDLAGVIESLGAEVDGWKVGDPVIAFLEARGAYAEYAVVPVTAIARKPEALSFERAAGIPTTTYAAWAVLVDSANVSAGQRVLIHGGAGGVGSAAVQIAKSRGAYVIATASKRNHEYLRSIGADETIDYRSERLEERVHDVDVAVNTVDAETATRSIAVMKEGGLVISVAGAADPTRCAAARVRCLLRSREGTPIATVLAEIAKLAESGRFDVNVDRSYSLQDAQKAWDAGQAGHTRGKLIITLR